MSHVHVYSHTRDLGMHSGCHTHTYTLTHTHTHMYTHMHTLTHTHMYTLTPSLTHTHMHTHLHTHSHTHMHILTHTHSQPQQCVPDVVIWMLAGKNRVACTRIPAHKLFFASGKGRGQLCSKVQTLFLMVRR